MAKIIYNEEMIFAKAIEMAIDVGFESITTRTLAKRIGCSTAPIYTVYKNIDELKTKIKVKIYENINEATLVSYTNDRFLNIGVGILVFARDHTNLYSEVFIKDTTSEFSTKYIEEFVNRMQTACISKQFTHEENRIILSKMWVVTHGIATIICSGRLKQLDTKFFISLLEELGLEIMMATALKAGKLESFMKEFNNRSNEEKFASAKWEVW